MTTPSKITVTLSSAALGPNTDEAFYDQWAGYVADHIDEVAGREVADVDQLAFGDAGEDTVSGATEDERERILAWLSVDGWEAFCAQPAQAAA